MHIIPSYFLHFQSMEIRLCHWSCWPRVWCLLLKNHSPPPQSWSVTLMFLFSMSGHQTDGVHEGIVLGHWDELGKCQGRNVLIKVHSHVTFAFTFNTKNGFHGNKWLCSHFAFAPNVKNGFRFRSEIHSLYLLLHHHWHHIKLRCKSWRWSRFKRYVWIRL